SDLGIAPPRSGWRARDTISVGRVHETAAAGVEEISTGAPEGSGGHAVKALRSRVWSREMTGALGTDLPGGLAFAATALRFIPAHDHGDDAERAVMGCGGWRRLVAPGGHLLTRTRR